MNNEKDLERDELLKEISNLKQQLLWYKRTYEERSLLGILYDRIFQVKNKLRTKRKINILIPTKKIKINKALKQSSLSNEIFCSIVNHNHSENAEKLFKTFINYFDTVIFDSGSENPPTKSVKYSNIYYSGLLNEAFSLAQKNQYKYLLFICSDVIIKEQQAQKLYSRLIKMDFKDVGLYAPSSKGGNHFFCKKTTADSLREVPFVEGFIFLCDIQILKNFCPIDTKENLYGWGLDIIKGFFTKKSGKRCLIDDNVEVEHLQGTGYSREIADLEMLSWVKTLQDVDAISFFEEQIAYIRQHSGKDNTQ